VQMHQDAKKTRQRARLSVYWPNIDSWTPSEIAKRVPNIYLDSNQFEPIHQQLVRLNKSMWIWLRQWPPIFSDGWQF
jgi:hypothetical protein